MQSFFCDPKTGIIYRYKKGHFYGKYKVFKKIKRRL